MFTSLKNYMRISSQSKKISYSCHFTKIRKLHLSESSLISAILDSCYKLTIFTKEEEKEQTIWLLYNLYEIYKPESMVSKKTSSESLRLSSRNFFLNIINPNLNSHFIFNPNFEEIKHYLNTPIDINLDLLLW